MPFKPLCRVRHASSTQWCLTSTPCLISSRTASSYDSLYPNASTLLPPALAYIQKQIPLHPDGSPSVFLGEYGFKASYWGAQGQATQSQKVIGIAQSAKLPLALYWAIYDNTRYGYWLVHSNDVEQPVYFVLQSAVNP
jgi:hypothetical protein